ncbi:type IV pilus biogenesis [mine drainage metagenome]|uniref:Type IV pilus biogenesis n=1 Tax=mine drainage metagenome TaxID=410659 RepID=A0A1J5PEJ1_9ZZZZ
MRIPDPRLAVAFALSAASVATALAAPCPASLGAAEQISCLQTQNAILEAQIKHKDLAEKLTGPLKDTRKLDLPVVSSTFGVGEQSWAVLSWAGTGGGALTVRPGQSVPGGWTVASIDQGRVTLRQGKITHVLLLAGNVSGEAPKSVPATPMPFTSLSGLPSVTTVPAFPGEK